MNFAAECLNKMRKFPSCGKCSILITEITKNSQSDVTETVSVWLSSKNKMHVAVMG